MVTRNSLDETVAVTLESIQIMQLDCSD